MFVDSTTDSVVEFVKRLSQYRLSLDINDWVRNLDDIDPYTINPNIRFDLIMVVEEKPTDYKKISMIDFYSNYLKEPEILTVSLTNIHEMVYDCETEQVSLPGIFKKLMMLACTEASVYLRGKRPIPTDLLAKLVKIKVLIMMWKAISTNKEEAALLDQKDYYAPPPGEGKGEKKKGGKKGGKAGKKDAKKKGTKKGGKQDKKKGKGKGKDKKSKSDAYPCDDVLNKSPIDEYAKSTTGIDDGPALPTHLFIVLIGFTNPVLIQYISMNGLNLSILVKFRETTVSSSAEDVKLKMPSESNYYSQEYGLKKDLYLNKASALEYFWKVITEAYRDINQYFLNESFIMNYNSPVLEQEITTSEIYLKLSENAYFHFLDALKKCQEFHELHKIYLNHLKVNKLGYGYFMTTGEMPHYEAIMSAIPFPISNPPFIIEGILQEIIARENQYIPGLDEVMYTKIRQERGHASATRWDSLYPSTSSNETTDPSRNIFGNLYRSRSEFFADICHQNQQQNFQCHVSFTDQIKRLLDYHRKRIIEYRKEPEGDLYQFLPVLDKNQFIIHESNYVELALIYFKYIPEYLKEIWINSLKTDPHIQTCKNRPEIPAEDETVFRNQLKDWCDILELDLDDLTNCILLLLYGKISCRETEDDDSVSSFVQERFYTQRVHCKTDLITNITMMESPENTTVSAEKIENHYEKSIPSEFKWLEDLAPNVALQKFYKAHNDYCCIDYRPIEMFNATLFRFHNNCDEFGLNQKRWSITLRTPVNFRDFMHMIVFKDTQFLLSHENKRTAIKKFYEDIVNYEKMVTKFTAEEQDFLFRESLKVLLSNPVVTEEGKGKKKGKKGKGGKKDKKKKRKERGSKKGKKGKGGKQSDKSKSKKGTDPRDIVEKEPFQPGISFGELVEDKEVEDYVNKFTLPALDFDEGLLRGVGSITTFHSLDNFTIVIEKYKVAYFPTTISANITMNGNSLFVHSRVIDEFAFHINLKNGGVIAFGKTPTVFPRKMRFYFLEQLQNKNLHCLGGAVPKRHQAIMATTYFHDTIQLPDLKRRDGVYTRPSFPGGRIKGYSKFSIRSITSKRVSWMREAKPARLVESLSTVIPIKNLGSDLSQQDLTSVSTLSFSVSETDNVTPSFTLQEFIDDVMKFKKLLPTAKFRIISSPLHRYSYIKRKKSDMDIILSDIIRYVLSMYTDRRKYIKIRQAYDLHILGESRPLSREPEISYRVTLPNGLHLKNIYYSDGTYIIQNYISKGPEDADILEEQYRLFLRDGNIAIRKVKGDIVVYQANGEIVHYQVPLNRRNWYPFFLFKKKNNNKKSVECLLESINRRVKRTNKPTLENYECSHFVSRTSSNFRRKQYKCKKTFILKEIKFNMTCYDGHFMRYHNGSIRHTQGYNYEKQEQIDLYQTVYKRSDGTVSIFNKLGVLETTFPDGTRISSWCDEDPKLITLQISKLVGYKVKMAPFVKVNIFFQYEHPKYASVTYDTITDDMKFSMPGDVQLQVSGDSCSLITDRNTLISVDTEKIVMESIPCEDCNKYCICKVNAKPLFYNEYLKLTDVFFKSKDTFDKLIIADFNGNIRRNANYVKDDMSCTSSLHKRYPTQKVMLMYNDLRAKYLWSETMYANKMADIIDSENTQIVLYINDKTLQVSTTEIRVYEPNFYNGQFKMPYLKPMVVNNDPKPKFEIYQSAYMKQRLLHSVSTANLSYLLNFVSTDETLMKQGSVQAFGIRDFIISCQPVDVSYESCLEVSKPTMFKRGTYDNKIKLYKEKLAVAYNQVQRAKDKRNIVPYFKWQQQAKEVKTMIQDSAGNYISTNLLSERRGKSNRSLTGSIFETREKSTTMSEISYDLLENIKLDDSLEYTYEKLPTYTQTIDDFSIVPNNMFSITTLDELTVSPIASKTIWETIKDQEGKKSKTILARKSGSQSQKDLIRPESRLRFADLPTKIHDSNLPTSKEALETYIDPDIQRKLDEINVSSQVENVNCMQDLQDALKNLVIRGAREENPTLSEEVKEPAVKADHTQEKADMEPSGQYQISKVIQRLFNIKRKNEETRHPVTPATSYPDFDMLSTCDSIDNDADSENGKDYVTSPSLQTVTSQMLTPSALQQFSQLEIQGLLQEVGIRPIVYHEISELDLVRQLMGLSQAAADQKTEEDNEEMELPHYEGMICDKKIPGDEEDLLDSDEEKATSSSSSLSICNREEVKEAMPGEEEVVEEEELEEEQSTVSDRSKISMKTIHRAPPHSAMSVKASVFDFSVHDYSNRDMSKDASMIPLLNEKSLLRAIKKDLKKVTEDMSAPNFADRSREHTVDISTSTSSSEDLPTYYSSSSTGDKTQSTSDTSASTFSSKTKSKVSVESPTPHSSVSTINISPSLRVFRDRMSYDAKFFNVMVENVGVCTAVKEEAEVGTDLTYGNDVT